MIKVIRNGARRVLVQAVPWHSSVDMRLSQVRLGNSQVPETIPSLLRERSTYPSRFTIYFVQPRSSFESSVPTYAVRLLVAAPSSDWCRREGTL